MAPTLASGEYYIANAKTLRYVSFGIGSESGSGWTWKSSSSAPDLVTVNDADGKNVKWTVTLQPNGEYILQNPLTQAYASVAQPKFKAAVGGRKTAGRWALKQGMLPHCYLVSAGDTGLYWGLGTEQVDVPVALDKSSTNALNHWLFISANNNIAQAIPAADPHNGLLSNIHRGFLPGYFKIKNRETGLYLTMHHHSWADGTPVIGWAGDPAARTQAFFIDHTGALTCKEGGITLDIADDALIGRQRRPITEPYPNPWSHPLPDFTYNAATGCIQLTFKADPAVTNWPQDEMNWKAKTFLLSTLPSRSQRVIVADEYATWAPQGTMASELAWTNANPIEPQYAVLAVAMEDGGEKDKRKQWDLELP